MLKENKDYTLIPIDDDNDQAWGIRVETGLYTETVMKFGAIEMGEDDQLHFNFELVSTPMDDLTVEDTDLQEYAGFILESVLTEAVEKQELAVKEKDKK